MYPKERYPTIAQGRNMSMQQAIKKAFNEEHGRKATAPISHKSMGFELWQKFREWTHTHASGYSVNENANVSMDGNGNVTARPVDFDGKLHWNYSELLAETFADVEGNGYRNASPLSRAVYDQVIWQYRQANGGLKARFQR